MRAQDVLASLRVALGSSDTRFSAALGSDRRISVTGAVKAGQPYLTRIGTFDVDLALRGNILLVRTVASLSALCLFSATMQAAVALNPNHSKDSSGCDACQLLLAYTAVTLLKVSAALLHSH